MKIDFIFRFHIRFFFLASFAFYFPVSDTSSRTIVMVYFNIETLNCSANPPSLNSFKKFCAAIATFKNLLKMTVLGERLNKTDMEKVGWKF